MNKTSKTYRSNGKLLLTAEYAVLDGAKALAIPTKYGQSLEVNSNSSNSIHWKSYNELGEIWYEEQLVIKSTLSGLHVTAKSDNQITERLYEILKAIRELKSEFLDSNQGYTITTHQDFNRLWGLGTSSTLINNLADWANVDAFQLLEKTFGGSGYDIACAQHNHPITFQLEQHQTPLIELVDFQPSFKQQLYFVYLNQKQNSRDGISAYKKLGKVNLDVIKQINSITKSMIVCQSLSEFQNLVDTHENIISKLIQQSPIKTRIFADFNGAVKSLGAWGGDFVLVASEDNPTDYFNAKGYETVIPYEAMVL